MPLLEVDDLLAKGCIHCGGRKFRGEKTNYGIFFDVVCQTCRETFRFDMSKTNQETLYKIHRLVDPLFQMSGKESEGFRFVGSRAPLGIYAFGSNGGPYRDVEELQRRKEALEKMIQDKPKPFPKWYQVWWKRWWTEFLPAVVSMYYREYQKIQEEVRG